MSRAAATPQQKFEAGVARVCQLREVPNATTDLTNESWAALRSGIVVARKSEELLDSRSEQEVVCVLEFLLQRGVQKKSARGQVRECLRVLLPRAPWLAAALADASLRRGAVEALDGEQDAELIARLAIDEAETTSGEGQGEEAPQPTEELPKSGGAAERGDPRLETEEARPREAPEPAAPLEPMMELEAPPPKPLSVRERLAQGKAVLEGFAWEYPHDVVGTSGDDATAGFQLIFEAVSALSRSRGNASASEEPVEALADLAEDWANLLHFLLSMYNSGVKRTYAARIRFVVVELRGCSPAFRGLAPWATLPWGGQLPMPAEEAEAEARALEDFQRQRAEEARNLLLAQELHAQEEAEALALKELQRQIVQEDFALACKLEEQGRRAEPVARRPTSRLARLRRRAVGGA